MHRGEYESALVLYHRAATVCPHDSSHNVAAQRTAAVINSWNHSQKSLVKFGQAANARHDVSLKVSVLESSALKARDVSKSCNNLSISPDISRYV